MKILITLLFSCAFALITFAQQDQDQIAPKTRYIDVSFKNPGLKKISAFVKGPKPSGGHFSYGLNFNPLLTKKERWTIGTKIYEVNNHGSHILLHEVRAEDEGQVVFLRGRQTH